MNCPRTNCPDLESLVWAVSWLRQRHRTVQITGSGQFVNSSNLQMPPEMR